MQEIDKLRGYWKFRDSITKEEVSRLAEEFAKDENYEELHIRKTSKDQLGLGFIYKNPRGETKEAMDKYMEETSDMLRRRYGNDLTGWDVGSWYAQIK